MHILITAGGTREYIDPVRFITNASSGRMGYELAKASLKAGHKVTLITTVDRKTPLTNKANIVKVQRAAEMFEAVKNHFANCDCLIMAAAVADYTPVKVSKTKIKKQKSELVIKLKPTVDILKWAGLHKNSELRTQNSKLKSQRRLVVGFALEDKYLLQNAQNKLIEKKLDMIVANSIDAIDSIKSTVHIKTTVSDWQTIENTSKSSISKKVIKLIETLF
ncbi:MAG: phosphopantothenoylcysteine decarboxylase [Sedimentisphaerales bacterium]|nr:phosphopantothenoylcysteine decarboxylase [Sedimentisphaerales bacterium]